MKIAVEQKGAGKATINLRELGVRASDVRATAPKVGRIVAASNKRRFDTRGQGRWQRLAPATVEKKARQGQDPRILRATGKLYRSLTDPKAGELHPDALAFGTDLPYARYADRGTVNEPKRKLIDLKPEERRQVTDVLSRYIVEARA